MDRQPLPARKGFKFAAVSDNMKKKVFTKASFEDYVKLIKTCKYLYGLGTDTLMPDKFDLGKWSLAVAPAENGVTFIHIVQRETIYHNDPRSYRLNDIQASFKHVHFGILEIPVMAGADIFFMGDCLNVDDNSLTDILTSLGDNGSTVARMIIPFIEWQSLAMADYWTDKLKMTGLVLTAMDSPEKFPSLYQFLYASDHIHWLQLEMNTVMRQWHLEVVKLYEFCHKKGPVGNKVIVLRMLSTEMPNVHGGHMQFTAGKVENYGCLCRRVMLARFPGQGMPLFMALLYIKTEIYVICLHASDPQMIYTAIQKVLCDRRYTDALFTPTCFCAHSTKVDRLHPKMFPEHEELQAFIKKFF